MNRIDELIKKLCPNGVEYRPIWSLTAWDKKFNGVDKEKQKKVISYKYYLSTDFTKVEKKNGNIKYISTGISGDDRYTTEELAGDYIADGEVVCIPWGGTPNVKYHKGKFVTGDNRIATSLDVNILSNKFLYYWMQSKINVISKFYRGSGIKHPSMKDVLDMNIAVPPLEVQCEIVHILDDFTLLSALLSAELSAELKARKKQYNFYKDKIFNISEKTNYVEIKDILQEKGYIRGPFGSALRKSDMVKNGVPIYEQQHAIYNHRNFRYFISNEKANVLARFMVKYGDIILSCSGTVGRTSIIKSVDEKGIINQALLILRVDPNKINVRFLEHFLKSSYGRKKILSNTNGSAQVNICKREEFEKIKIPLPKMDEQNEIVNILDRFDKLCNDISEGLPAEIEARQKQYEYYRDKLLTFKELKVNE